MNWFLGFGYREILNGVKLHVSNGDLMVTILGAGVLFFFFSKPVISLLAMQGNEEWKKKKKNSIEKRGNNFF